MINNTRKYSVFLFAALLSCILSACNTTQEKKSTPVTETPSSSSSQSQSQQNSASQQSTAQKSSQQSNQEKAQSNKTEDEILDDALKELERNKAAENKSNNEQNNNLNTDNSASTLPVENTASQAAPATGSLTTDEKTSQLDSKLDERFSEFDELLLKEQERLTQEQNEQGDLSATAGGGAASGEYGYEEGGGFEDGGDEFSVSSEQAEPQQAGGSNPFPSNTTQADIPPDLVSTKGDDVIARQLREAALKEQDPELREKLWDEYRKYKKGIGR